MKRKIVFIIHLIFISLPSFLISDETTNKASITFQVPGGRLGNRLIAYIKTKHAAMQKNLRYLVPPFLYSNRFAFSAAEESFNRGDERRYQNIKRIQSPAEINQPGNPNILYLTTFFFRVSFMDQIRSDPQFRETIRSMLAQRNQVAKESKQNSKQIIGVHIRTGGTYDNRKSKQIFPNKFTPIERYIPRLQKLIADLKPSNVHIKVFTDDSNPKKILRKLRLRLRNTGVTMSCRLYNNQHDKNVVEDLFDMAACDYLFRPDSTYSIIAEIIGNHKQVFVVYAH